MNVNPTSASGGSRPIESYANDLDAKLSGDALLIFIQTQLGSLDRDISAYIAQQKRAITQKDALATVENAMKKYNPPATMEAWNEIRDAFRRAIDELPPGDPVRAELQAKLDALQDKYLSAAEKKESRRLTSHAPRSTEPRADLVGANEGGRSSSHVAEHVRDVAETAAKAPTKDAWASLIGDVQQLREDISSNAELRMMQLQSLMSQRQTAVQLVTNIMAKFDQTLASIVAKIGAV